MAHRGKVDVFYKLWVNMRGRCNNSKRTNYYLYGGRGITVCVRWNTFENFRDDMYQSYLKHVEEFGRKDTSIDRLNNEGNYCLENCRWATKLEQSKNRRSNVKFNNELAVDAEKRLGISRGAIHSRLSIGWDIERAFTSGHSYKNASTNI